MSLDSPLAMSLATLHATVGLPLRLLPDNEASATPKCRPPHNSYCKVLQINHASRESNADCTCKRPKLFVRVSPNAHNGLLK